MKENNITEHEGNPYLPLWEYIPDGEPYVFEDPQNSGCYRVYIYGSHDILKTQYCGKDLVVWSAPVDDLSKWRYDGVIFRSKSEDDYDILFAPDIALKIDSEGNKTYYLYPNTQSSDKISMVAKSSSPIGPFKVCNWADDKCTKTNGVLGFDPAVLVDTDGSVYAYWGFAFSYHGVLGSYWGELDKNNMSTLKAGTTAKRNIPTYDQMFSEDYNPNDYNIVIDENIKKWGFFEASSIRKVGNKYVFIYSRNGLEEEPTGKNYAQLAYGYSDSPKGPWKYGGIIVDAAGETIPNSFGGYDRTYMGGNTHGSICQINNQWYIFYHRNLHKYARQAVVEPISIYFDDIPVCDGGKVCISTAEVTSNGFSINGLNPLKKHSVGIASYIIGGALIKPEYDKNINCLPIINIKNNVVFGIKYFNFEQITANNLSIELIPKGIDAQIYIYLRPVSAQNTPIQYNNGNIVSVGTDSKLITSLQLNKNMPQKLTNFNCPVCLDGFSGKWGLFFAFKSENVNNEICDMYNIQFN